MATTTQKTEEDCVMHFTETKKHVARKPHRCSWCGEPIQQGETYSRYRCFYDRASTVKLHPECQEALQEEARLEGGAIEFIPYDNERPTK